MTNSRIKVAGYTKKIEYSGGIEYRNFSDSLVGNQFTSDGGTTLFTAANFNITTNLEDKDSKNFTSKPFSDFINLEDLKMSQDEVISILDNNTKTTINFDKTILSNYAYFGSLREFIRVSLESIILNWPASIYVSPINEFNPFLGGPSFENYTTNELIGTANFSVNSNRFINKFNINYTQNGQILNSFSNENDLRNLSVNYKSYNVSTIAGEFPIIGFTGATENNNSIYFEVLGKPFISSATTINYHIKPNSIKGELFFNNLNVFEGNLLNRLTTPKYTSEYTHEVETEKGSVILTKKVITWPVSDGYNIDFDSDNYINFVSELLSIADVNDKTNTNLMTRFLISESITDFDTIDQKMGNTLRIYGREFDEVKKYIDGLANANTVTYNSHNNTPDLVLKNLAKVMGWDLISSIADTNLVNNYLTTSETTFSGHSRGLTPVEAEVELWRRIILNTPWIWKSKGTRKAIEFLFKFIGSPSGLVDFNEFIYVAKKPLDMELFNEVLIANSGYTGINELNIDSEGFPKTLPDTSEMYFQKGGLWYRETGGPNSNVDILTGNNPHIGPYDGGQEYINQFSCLIPDFIPVTIIEEIILTGSTNLFVNYFDGTFGTINSGTTTPLFIDALNQNNQEISNCVLVTSEIINTYPEIIEVDDCGCPVDNSKNGSLRINIVAISSAETDCGYSEFTLGEDGFVIFTLYNGNVTNFISSECCTILGFTPEIVRGIYNCRWQVIPEPCDNFTPSLVVETLQTFINSNGETVTEVPSAECCPVDSVPELSVNGYVCRVGKPPINCNGYSVYTIDNDGYVVFKLSGETTTTIIDVECCEALGFEGFIINNQSRCKVFCEEYISYSGVVDDYLVFVRPDNSTYISVPLAECCPVGSTAIPSLNYYPGSFDENGLEVVYINYQCKKN